MMLDFTSDQILRFLRLQVSESEITYIQEIHQLPEECLLKRRLESIVNKRQFSHLIIIRFESIYMLQIPPDCSSFIILSKFVDQTNQIIYKKMQHSQAGPLPMSASNLPRLVPMLKWAQSKQNIFLTINIPNLESSHVNFTSDGLSLEKVSATLHYKMDLQFYDEIEMQNIQWHLLPTGVEIVMQKRNQSAPFWPRLTKSEQKMHNLSIDWNRYVDEDEERGIPRQPNQINSEAPKKLEPIEQKQAIINPDIRKKIVKHSQKPSKKLKNFINHRPQTRSQTKRPIRNKL